MAKVGGAVPTWEPYSNFTSAPPACGGRRRRVRSLMARFPSAVLVRRLAAAAGLVVGRPTSVQGEPHAMTRQAEDFARRLERRFKLPVARVDERFSSVEAEARLRGIKRKNVDSVAAQLILEQYFDEAA